jgi:hypothetical protein
MVFDWNEAKKQQLKKERGIGFERIVLAIDESCILDILEHPNKDKYPNQYLIVVEVEDYAYVVPAVREKEYWFLKTLFPSRKYTERYLLEKRRKK